MRRHASNTDTPLNFSASMLIDFVQVLEQQATDRHEGRGPTALGVTRPIDGEADEHDHQEQGT